MDTAEKIAEFLLSIKAFKFNLAKPYVWASGWQAPVYCDNRLTLSYPNIRSFIANAMAERVQQRWPSVEAIAGVATAGIPYGTLVADRLKLPFVYVRSQPKQHGLGNQIEGGLYSGERVVVVEDLVSTGGSSLNAVEALRGQEVEILGLISIFNYRFQQSDSSFKAAEVPYEFLCDLGVLAQRATFLNMLPTDALTKIEAWRAEPETWAA